MVARPDRESLAAREYKRRLALGKPFKMTWGSVETTVAIPPTRISPLAERYFHPLPRIASVVIYSENPDLNIH